MKNPNTGEFEKVFADAPVILNGMLDVARRLFDSLRAKSVYRILKGHAFADQTVVRGDVFESIDLRLEEVAWIAEYELKISVNLRE